jgi:predicted RNA-binding protein with PUA-like domain
MNWLFKEEPGSYSFDRLTQDGGTRWSGVRNPLAQKHLRSVRKGDRVLYYHTGNEKAVVGMARAATAPYPDPADPAGRRSAVDIVPLRKLARPVSLAEIKGLPAFAGHPLLRIPRLSVMPISGAQFVAIERLAARVP